MMAPKKIKINKSGKSEKEDGKREIEHLKNQLARALADYDNLRKRVEREREGFGKFANARLVIRLLPIHDMLEGAQSHLHDSGLAITLTEFVKVLEDEGIQKIEAKAGDKFDEKVHEAVEAIDDKDKAGRIAEIVITGWRFSDGQVIRPAKVKVYGKPEEEHKKELEKEISRGDYV